MQHTTTGTSKIPLTRTGFPRAPLQPGKSIFPETRKEHYAKRNEYPSKGIYSFTRLQESSHSDPGFLSGRVMLGRLLRCLNAFAPPLASRIAIHAFMQTRSRRVCTGQRPLSTDSLDRDIPGAGNVRVWGTSGPWALLVHDWGKNSTMLYPIADRLARAGYRAVTFDAPSHGVAPGGKKCSMTDFAEVIALFLRNLGKPHLVVAHGIGGIASVSAATLETEPDRMVLLSTPCDLSMVLERWAYRLELPRSLIRRIRQELDLDGDSTLEDWDLRKQGRSLFCPVLVIHGQKDALVPESETDRVVRAIPRAGARIEPHLGHNDILMNKQVQEVILAFSNSELATRLQEPAAKRSRAKPTV